MLRGTWAALLQALVVSLPFTSHLRTASDTPVQSFGLKPIQRLGTPLSQTRTQK